MLIDSWVNFSTAFAVFFASHLVLIRPPVRPVLVKVLTPRGFSAVYSLLSLLVLWWLITAAQSAPYVELWPWEPWQNWVPLIVMLPACLLLTFGIAVPNPFSFGGARNGRFDPQRPGIIGWTRHPILVALFLWSAAHLVPNGSLALFVLFGTFAAFSLAGMKLVDRRRRREMGEDWIRLQTDMRQSTARLEIGSAPFLIRCLLGALLYAVLGVLHPYFAGVHPFT